MSQETEIIYDPYIYDRMSIQEEIEVVSKLEKEFQFATQLEGNDLPIFVDTNFLLAYYKVRFSNSKTIAAFLKKYSEQNRLYITDWVRREFIKNRYDNAKDVSENREELKKLKDGFKDLSKIKSHSIHNKNWLEKAFPEKYESLSSKSKSLKEPCPVQ
ncbi:MAG: PIN-like domain-containing protein [Spirochaetota bacterium]